MYISIIGCTRTNRILVADSKFFCPLSKVCIFELITIDEYNVSLGWSVQSTSIIKY